jgi:hypothetical protein
MAIVKNIHVGKTRFTFVGKYRYSKIQKRADNFMDFRDWRIGIWFKKNKIVGRNNFSDPKNWKDNFVDNYTVGFDLLIFRWWVTWDKGGMHLGINEEK